MQVFDASQFGSLAGPSFLTQIAHRPDAIPGPSGPRPTLVRIYASTTRRSIAGLSTTFADNLGTNTSLVFEGTVPWTTSNLPGPEGSPQFDIAFPLTTPFLYDPRAGNLVLDIQFVSGDGPAIRWDAVSGNSTVRKLIAFTSATAASGSFINATVTQFTFQSAPQVTIRSSQVEVCWNSVSNATYHVEYRSDLTGNLWTTLVNCFRSTGSTSCVSDSIIVGQPQRFYRVVQTNCAPD